MTAREDAETVRAAKQRMSDLGKCANGGKHTPQPTGYLQWHMWAEEKAKTHRQERCPACGLWSVWKPKARRG